MLAREPRSFEYYNFVNINTIFYCIQITINKYTDVDTQHLLEGNNNWLSWYNRYPFFDIHNFDRIVLYTDSENNQHDCLWGIGSWLKIKGYNYFAYYKTFT